MFKRITLLAAITASCGCIGPVSYAPACPAYSGDRIQVSGSRFSWDKFTDVVRIDAEGNRVDPYPAYPRKGRVESSGSTLRFVGDDGELIGEFIGYRIDGQRFLLTEQEHSAVRAGESVPDCALVQSASER